MGHYLSETQELERELKMDDEKLAQLSDGCESSADYLPAIQSERAMLLHETAHIIAALSEVELILSSMRGRIKAWCAT